MSDWPTIEQLVKQRDEWIEKFGIPWHDEEGRFYHDEVSDSDRAKLEELDKQNLVWTHHGTCENEVFTAGYHVYEGTGCGCWESRTYFVAEKPHDGDTTYSIDSEALIPCQVCNEDGDGSGEDGCEGPELPETDYGVEISSGISDSVCEEGWVKIYLD